MTLATTDERPPCRCGHAWSTDHARGFHPDERATDCRTCGPDACPAYRAPRRTWRSWFLRGAA